MRTAARSGSASVSVSGFVSVTSGVTSAPDAGPGLGPVSTGPSDSSTSSAVASVRGAGRAAADRQRYLPRRATGYPCCRRPRVVAVVDPLELVVVAFAGGAFGAAVGALEAFSLAGVLVVVGEAVDVAADGVPGPSGDPAALGSSGLTALTGLGPLFGPHVAFAGGAAATAFAARQGYLDSDFDYHEAKHVTAALGPRADVMAVGGAFGVVGVGLVAASVRLGLPFDPISFGIVVSGLLHRLVLGFPLIGTIRGETPLDMTPYERRIRRPPPR